MKETLLIKHAVNGRLFFDTRQLAVPYAVTADGDGWSFAVETPLDDNVELLLRCKEELNVFLFNEFDDAPTLKTWYYVKDGPVLYDAGNGVLRIYAQSRIPYYPHQYSQ